MRIGFVLVVLLVAGCAAPPRRQAPTLTPAARARLTPAARMMMRASRHPPTPDDRFGPLEVGADYLRYRKLTPQPFLSRVHGNRWVDVYVNEIGADAYLDGTRIPVGTVVVKASYVGRGGKGARTGPIFIMEKRAPGYAPDHGDWRFALFWPSPPPALAKMIGGPVYWRGPSPRVAFCADCHDSYDRELGGLVPTSILPR